MVDETETETDAATMVDRVSAGIIDLAAVPEVEALRDVPGADGAVAWAMVEASPDALVMVDEHGVIELVNHQTELLFGYERVELLGKPVEMLLPERLGGVHRAHRTGFRVSPEVRAMGSGMELAACRADGAEFPVEVSLSPLHIGGGLRIIAAVRDVSARVAAESKSKQIRRGLDSILDGLYMFSPETWEFVYVNEGAANQSGYCADTLMDGMTPLHLAPDFSCEQFAELLRPLAEGETQSLRFDTAMLRRSGETFPVEVVLEYPDLGGAQNRVFVSVVRDVSERVEAEHVRARHEELQAALSGVRLAMLRGASRVDGLQLLCRSTRSTLDALTAFVVTPVGGSDDLMIEAASGLRPDIGAALSFKRTVGLVGDVFETGRAQLTRGDDPRIAAANRPVVSERRISSILAAPLRGSDGIVGVLLAVRGDEQHQLDDRDLAAIELFASEAVVAIELSASRESAHRLELLEDRERIGRDMHDNVIGRLFATGMSLQATSGHVIDATARARIDKAVDEIDGAIKEIRSTIYGIRSQLDWGKGVRGQILATAADKSDLLGFEPLIKLSGPIDQLPEAVIDALLATLREGLTNAAKHANATNVIVDLEVADAVRLRIEDNGSGLAQSTEPAADSAAFTSNGLRNMATRAQELGGRLTVASTAGNGTTLEWVVPAP